MPKLVTKKIWKIIKNNFSLNGKIIEIHCKANVFDALECCMCEQERYQQNIKSDTKIHPQIYEKSIQTPARKRDTQKMTISKKISKKDMKIRKNSKNNKRTNREKRGKGRGAGIYRKGLGTLYGQR